jgi:hypothetical protein
MPAQDTLATFEVAPDFTMWEVRMTRESAERLLDWVTTSVDPDHTVTFCNECPDANGVDCPHSEKIRIVAISNFRLQPLIA